MQQITSGQKHTTKPVPKSIYLVILLLIIMEKQGYTHAILEILNEYSDNEHGIRRNEIERYLALRFNITLSRKTLYGGIAYLRKHGYNIRFKNGKYYFLSREFTKPEIILLCSFLSESLPDNYDIDIEALKIKLYHKLSKYQRIDCRDVIFIDQTTQFILGQIAPNK